MHKQIRPVGRNPIQKHEKKGITVTVFKKKKSVLALAGLLSAGSVAAQGFEPSIGVYKPMTQLKPAPIEAEPFDIIPWVVAGIGNDDNVGLSNANKSSSRFAVLNPNVSAVVKGDAQTYAAEYAGSYGRYTSSSQDDYYDHKVALDADNSWTGRFSTRVRVDYLKGHDPRNALHLSTTAERWHTSSARAAMQYGAEGAQGQLDLEAGFAAKRYDTNTVVTSGFDRDQRNLSGTFYYRLAPATQALVQVRDTHFAYVSPFSSALTSTERRYLVGLKWTATAQTSGSLKVGSMKKTFDTGVLPSGSGTTWEGEVKWSPLSYSIVDLSAMRTTSEATGTGNFIITSQQSLAWNHEWSSRVASALAFDNATDTFQGVVREDRRKNYGVKLSYGVQRWLRLGAELQRQERNSTDAQFTYTRNLALVTLEGSL